jgi:two-component system response regulator WspF
MRAACEALRRVVDSLPDHKVIWTAFDGVEAIAMAKRDRPDLILMDLIMPHVDGAQATRQIMAAAPCAILVVTATVSGNISLVYEAMGHGALDAVDTPMLGPTGEVSGAGALVDKIGMIAKLVGVTGETRKPDRPAVGSAPPRLLVYSADQGWEPLCAFLGLPVPATPFPNVNDRPTIQRVIRGMTRGAYGILLALDAMAGAAIYGLWRLLS